jgi:hypothetical protein
MPYGFYQLVRLLAFVGFAALAFIANKEGRQTEMIVYIVLAVLFQPLLKISLGSKRKCLAKSATNCIAV